MNRLFVIIISLFTFFNAYSSSDEESSSLMNKANDLYIKGEYEEAKNIYVSLAEHSQSVALYYNLGNCYYRLDDLAHAIINYERAYRLDPNDIDVKHNLEVSRNQTIDKIVGEDADFLSEWTSGFTNMFSSNGWAKWSIFFFILALSSISLYLFGPTFMIRRIGFGVFAFSLLLFVVATANSCSQKNRLNSRNQAIIVNQTSTAKSSPEETSKDVFVLHEGTKVDVLSIIGEYFEVQLVNGNKGWMLQKDLEVI